jgi:hypothetical protein
MLAHTWNRKQGNLNGLEARLRISRNSDSVPHTQLLKARQTLWELHGWL